MYDSVSDELKNPLEKLELHLYSLQQKEHKKTNKSNESIYFQLDTFCVK